MKIEDHLRTNFSSPQIKAVVNLRYTYHFISQLQSQFMDQFDLTMPQFNILRILRGAKEYVSVNTVKERMVEKSPNTTRLMDKLIDKGLIIRERCEEDRRVVYVKISESGMSLLQKIDLALSQNKLLSTGLAEPEAELLSDLLDKLREQWAK